MENSSQDNWSGSVSESRIKKTISPDKKQTRGKRSVGRPKKAELKAATGGKVGRPKGTAGIIAEYRDRMLASPKSRKVMDAIFDAALDHDHKNQAAAWKIIADRIMPISAFEQDLKRSGGKSGITINISGIGEGVNISGSEDEEVIEGDFSESDS